MKERDYKQECIDLWEELAETGERNKWVAHRRLGLKNSSGSFCSACDYVVDKFGEVQHSSSCGHLCPIDWGVGPVGDQYTRSLCEESLYSPYAFWGEAETKDGRKQYAAEMVAFIKKYWRG